ncbi:hypothetical protein NL676_011106 [Syzygium grande]|nr:hypothetical protein NL676_011106 [Syzygium grande]
MFDRDSTHSTLQEKENFNGMDPYNKTGIVILFMLFINSYSAAVMGFSEVENPAESLRKVMSRRNMRELTMLEAVLDYDSPGANMKHDQGKGKTGPGGGGTPNP